MITFTGELSEPTASIMKFYKSAVDVGEISADACCISTISKDNIPDSRFVNIKYIQENELIFFTNYNSKKSKDILFNKNASLVFFWKNINVQIRMLGKIKKTSDKFSDLHFKDRSFEKNIVAIISDQSSEAKNYKEINNKYKRALAHFNKDSISRPDYWGGFSFSFYKLEIWKGSETRLNERNLYEKLENGWTCKTLQP